MTLPGFLLTPPDIPIYNLTSYPSKFILNKRRSLTTSFYSSIFSYILQITVHDFGLLTNRIFVDQLDNYFYKSFVQVKFMSSCNAVLQ